MPAFCTRFSSQCALAVSDRPAQQIARLGREITGFYRGKPLTLVSLMNGALPFAADLMRVIDLPLYVDTVSVSSYHDRKSSGKLNFRSTLKLSPESRDFFSESFPAENISRTIETSNFSFICGMVSTRCLSVYRYAMTVAGAAS